MLCEFITTLFYSLSKTLTKIKTIKVNLQGNGYENRSAVIRFTFCFQTCFQMPYDVSFSVGSSPTPYFFTYHVLNIFYNFTFLHCLVCMNVLC